MDRITLTFASIAACTFTYYTLDVVRNREKKTAIFRCFSHHKVLGDDLGH